MRALISESEELIKLLFKTNAIKVCPSNKPFWYTSGTLGPYYINTHYLYGSEEKACKLLDFIDKSKTDISNFPENLTNELSANYSNDYIYKTVIDQLNSVIEEKIGIDNIDYISGGERRDWFFSFPVAKLLQKPHLTIYKDRGIYEYCNSKVRAPNMLDGKNILHISDLLTEGSSFEKTWIPAVKNFGGKISWSIVVVDRKQGGKELLKQHNINLISLTKISDSTFKLALDKGLINSEQYEMIIDFIKDPKEFMKNFLVNNPDFINNTLANGGKDAERAKIALQTMHISPK